MVLNKKLEIKFENEILFIKFIDGALIELEDIKSVYSFGEKASNNKRFCILFDATTHFDVTEEVVDFISSAESNEIIIAKAYVVNNKENEIKAKLHLAFDKPARTPKIVKTINEGKEWLNLILSMYYNSKHVRDNIDPIT